MHFGLFLRIGAGLVLWNHLQLVSTESVARACNNFRVHWFSGGNRWPPHPSFLTNGSTLVEFRQCAFCELGSSWLPCAIRTIEFVPIGPSERIRRLLVGISAIVGAKPSVA